ncbi:MAG: hypothetical protein M1337_02670 [Actinobacteria bacterium]|nr:hypothetical protein [Actinomycetota bacterium]
MSLRNLKTGIAARAESLGMPLAGQMHKPSDFLGDGWVLNDRALALVRLDEMQQSIDIARAHVLGDSVDGELFDVAASTGLDVDALSRASQQAAFKPLKSLRTIQEARAALDRLEHAAVVSARRSKRSWEQIGSALGMSKQAARKRHLDVQ